MPWHYTYYVQCGIILWRHKRYVATPGVIRPGDGLVCRKVHYDIADGVGVSELRDHDVEAQPARVVHVVYAAEHRGDRRHVHPQVGVGRVEDVHELRKRSMRVEGFDGQAVIYLVYQRGP
eukprot:scaffold290915_cov48-Prasinocladus_malaysianus.AAC.1